jgi:hypothetical protein
MPDPSDIVSNTSHTPDPSQDQASQPQPSPSPAASAQPSPQPAGQPAGPQGANNQAQTPGTVGNSSTGSVAPATAAPVDPAVIRASRFHDVAQALTGGPRYTYTIDPNTGDMQKTVKPVSTAHLGFALALEAISGALTGLAQRGPGAGARGAEMAFQQGQQQIQDQQQQAVQAAQTLAKSRSDALARSAQAVDLNSRVLLNTSQSERYGVESLKDAVNQNAKLLSDYDDAGAIEAQNISQDALMAGMKTGEYNATKQIAIPDGWTNISGKFEQTFSVVSDGGKADVPLTNDQVRSFAAANVPGFLPYKDGKTRIPDNATAPGTIVARANAQVQAINLMKQDVAGVVDTLSKSDDKSNQELAKNIPSFQTLMDDPKRGAGLMASLGRMQRFVSHSDQHGMDFAESLAQMAEPSKPDPNNPKVSIPNPDAPFAQTIYGAFGNGDPAKGKAILSAYTAEITPEPIKNEGDAASIIANNEPGSKAFRIAQRWIQSNTAQKAAVARAGAEAREAAKPIPVTPASMTQPDATGFVPTLQDVKEYNKRQDSFKKQADSLATTEGTYQQFNNALTAVANGNFTGAQSVVSLFDAIGLSATPLAGKGFRVNQNTIAEHENARGWAGALQQKFLNAKAGDVITPQQVKDYASIANQARISQYVNLANQVHADGLGANFVLPTGNGQRIDPGTAQIFLHLTGNNAQAARAAATAKGWQF